MRRTRRQLPDTACGYCFDAQATEWDHMIPWSYRRDNSEANLMPSCHRCNAMLYNKVFETIEERREYVQNRRGKDVGGTSLFSWQRNRKRFKAPQQVDPYRQAKPASATHALPLLGRKSLMLPSPKMPETVNHGLQDNSNRWGPRSLFWRRKMELL